MHACVSIEQTASFPQPFRAPSPRSLINYFKFNVFSNTALYWGVGGGGLRCGNEGETQLNKDTAALRRRPGHKGLYSGWARESRSVCCSPEGPECGPGQLVRSPTRKGTLGLLFTTNSTREVAFSYVSIKGGLPNSQHLLFGGKGGTPMQFIVIFNKQWRSGIPRAPP